MNGHSAPQKKLKVSIKLKGKGSVPADFEEQSWAKLLKSIEAVQQQQAVEYSMEDLVRTVNQLCLHSQAAKLYQRLQSECANHIARVITQLQQQIPNCSHSEFLNHVERSWQAYQTQMQVIKEIFIVLDRTFVRQQAVQTGVQSLQHMGLKLFRQQLQQHSEVTTCLVQGVQDIIKNERQGGATQSILMRTISNMLSSLDLYSSLLHKTLLSDTDAFYVAESTSKIRDCSLTEYLQHVQQRLELESDRCVQCFQPETRPALIKLVEDRLLRDHQDEIIDPTAGFKQLIDKAEINDLKLLYSLIGRVNGTDALRLQFKACVRAAGLELVSDPEQDKHLVANVLAFKSNIDQIVSKAFGNSIGFVQAQRDAFESFINSRDGRAAQLVAKYLDTLLRDGGRTLLGKDEDLDSGLDNALVLFKYIQGKDVFEAFYKKDLAKRLLLGVTSQIEAEKTMISKLKTECGAAFTNRLEGMFTDVETSRDTLAEFIKGPGSTECEGITFGVNVLTMSFWPTYKNLELRLPPELCKISDAFTSFYLKKHAGRQVKWCQLMGSCVIKSKCFSKPKEFVTSTAQAVILYLFNKKPKLSYKDLLSQSGLPATDLNRTLGTLIAPNKVLIKSPESDPISSKSEFSVNEKFSHVRYRVRLNVSQVIETTEEEQKVNEQVQSDRQHQIEAAIVRIMKSRNTLSHSLLLEELSRQLHFTVQSDIIKKRIGSLIERDFMKKCDDTADAYQYVA